MDTELIRTGRFAWNNAMKMLPLLLLLPQVLSEETTSLLPPKDVYVSEGRLTWTPAAENATYTVEYRGKGRNEWREVPACVQIPSSSCDFSSIRNNQGNGCVSVRVRAKRDDQTSTAVEACSHDEQSCSPGFSLSPGPGSMTVRLTRNSSLIKKHADHVTHLIYFGEEGEQLTKHEEAAASETIRDLEEGQRYCAWVQYVYMTRPVGPPRCMQCETTLVKSAKETAIITAVVVVIILIVLVPLVSYILIFQLKKIKQMLRVPYEIPNLFPEPGPEQRVFLPPSSDEHYDVITSMTPRDARR
ncbi:uncharacterized protein LOC121649743 isoform X2 [Melanotaenia boesemani]|uniref:uncharacterized protein LOC121649743 isoform X2 n=1 Tax=Melanotaenia boesemani TaxID=1250792 RepID=UPI001C05AD21|nr:uncharacterized protein LOC121649743 isoform X2 [Melanotaenia boesemani]